jgi:hypothetical protein
MAIYMRMGWPSKALQLTSAPLAITSPSSTARPGGEMLARFEEESQNKRVAAGCETGFSLPYA